MQLKTENQQQRRSHFMLTPELYGCRQRIVKTSVQGRRPETASAAISQQGRFQEFLFLVPHMGIQSRI
jgi:hypothetical protein